MPIVENENAEHYQWGENCDGWHLLKSPNLSVIEERVPSGSREERHYHNKSEQFFYIKSGTATIEIDGDVYTLTVNQGIHIQPAIPHQFMNLGPDEVVFLVISTPPSHGDRVNC